MSLLLQSRFTESPRALLVALMVLSLTGVTRAGAADGAPQPGPLPGHSVHGETFDAGPRRAARPMAGAGDVHFPVTTKSADAQRWFDQGMGQLHGFWYLEAERSFRQVAALDPDCAMAYWGMAMANFNNEARAKGFIAEAAKRRTVAMTPLELLWIDALDARYREEPKDETDRKRNFLAAVKQISAIFPDDVEAKSLYVRFQWEYRSPKLKIEDFDATDRLLEDVFAKSPMHPAHHYRIHLWDDKDAARALGAAAKNGPAAPGVAHMWHMPGHTYSKLHRYADAAFAQEASARVDHAYMARDRVMPYEIHNYAHNNEWLVRDLVYCGRVRDAADLAANMIELPRHPKHNDPAKGGSGAQLGRARLTDVLTRHEMWDAYLAACEPGRPLADAGDPAVSTPEQRVRRLRYLGVAAAATGNAQRAMDVVVELETLRAKLRVEMYQAGAKAEAEAKSKGKKPDELKGARKDAQRETSGVLDAIKAAVAHVAGQQAAAAGDFASAAEQWGAAGDVPKEQLALLHLKAGDNAKALEVAKKAVDDKKNQTLPMAAHVEVLHGAGKKDDARAAFERLRNVSAGIDLAAPPYARLAPVAADLGFPADWRKPETLAADVGTRPALDALGPFRWSPWAAPDFTAVGGDGSTVSLSSYRGRPVVVLFYLGHACLHCTRQLQAFAPLTRQFSDAGVAVVAVSTDAPADLHRAWEAAKVDAADGGAFPFPLASDATLDVFRRFDCYDDFERAPLHGTFLLDAAGRVRWREIGADPFTDAPFLLGESKRLLAQPLVP